jgi:hypothetical protein
VLKRVPAALAAIGLLAAGCGGSGSVTGTVTLDGAPLKRGTVTFHPVAGGATAIGGIGADGTYELAVGNDRSIPAGNYLVTVESTEAPSAAAPADPRKPPAAPTRLTPDRYAARETTDLQVTVKGGGNKIPLELKSGR